MLVASSSHSDMESREGLEIDAGETAGICREIKSTNAMLQIPLASRYPPTQTA